MSTNRIPALLKPKLLIKTKLILSAVITIGLALVVALTVFLQYRNLGRAERTENFADRVIKDVSDLNSLSYAYLLLKDNRPKVQWQIKHTSLGKLLSEDIATTPDEQALIARLRPTHERIKVLFDLIVNRVEESDVGAEKTFFPYAELNEGIVAQLLASSEMIVYDASLLVRKNAQLRETVRWRSFILVFASALMLTMSACLTAFFLAKSIGGSIRRLEHGTQKIAAGDLAYRVNVGGNDEISCLAAAFNDMTAKLETSYLILEREIGERKQAEQALKELNQTLEQRIAERTIELAASEQRWATTLASIGDAVIATDKAGMIIFINTVAQSLTGWQPEEAVGQPLQDVFRIINEKTLEPREDIAERVLQEGVIVALSNNTALLTREGRSIPIEDSAAPIKDREGKVTGVVLVFHDVSERRRAQEALQERTLELQHLTETLEERVEERTAELAALSSRLVSAQENERRRVAYDLHDNVWQTLDIIKHEVEHLFSSKEEPDWPAIQQRSRRLMTLISNTVATIRSMQGDLWPYVLEDIGIAATLEWYSRELTANRPSLSVERHVDLTETEVPASVKIVIYRLMQEALSNVVKHSRANRVTLRLLQKDHRVEFSVEDNGIGFDAEEAIANKSPWGGLGLLSIKARTELSGGMFGVESAKGKGTVVRASWTLDKKD